MLLMGDLSDGFFMTEDPHDSEEKERAERIEALKRRARELAGGEVVSHTDSEVPAEVEEKFLNYVVAFEEAPWIKNRVLMERLGIALPAPDTLNDEALSEKLWEVIEGLAAMQHFLEETNHLSDRELYTLLLTDVLEEETKDMFMDADSACHIPLCGSGSDEDNYVYLKYYADEKYREMWRKEFPGEPVPEHVDPAYDRDRFLPFHDHGERVVLPEDDDSDSVES